jgi:hypothetical protein
MLWYTHRCYLTMKPTMNKTRPWYTHPAVHIVAIVIVAALFRLWRLQSLPPGLFGDEATDGLDALDVLAGRGAVFFPANYGREGLHMWIIAGMFRLFGVIPLALRLPSALAGILTAVATYWLGVELLAAWRGARAGAGAATLLPLPRPYSDANATLWSFLPLVAALYLATSYWHVHFSRFGIRGVFTPLCGALAFAGFWRAVNRRSYLWFAFGGFCMGLATHFYTASRFYPFFLGGFLLVQWAVAALSHREDALLPRHFKGILLYYAVALLVFAPLGVYFLQHPGSFTQRASEVAAFSGSAAASPVVRMAQAAVANVLQFVVPGMGDLERFYNLPGRAVFDVLTAVFAVIGLGVLLWRWKRGPVLFLLLWFPSLLLPSFLATDRWPTLPRVLGVIPGVYFFPAVGLLFVASLLVRALSGRSARLGAALASGLVMVSLLVHAAGTYRAYFVAWGPAQATYDAFEGDMTAAMRWLADMRPTSHVYLSSDIYRHPTFMLLNEHATVQTYFTHANPNLSWFDARQALPLPPAGESAVYLITAPAPLAQAGAERLAAVGQEFDRVPAPDGSPAVTVMEVPAEASLDWGAGVDETTGLPFTDELSLVSAALATAEDGAPQLRLLWRTGGPEPGEWAGYRLEAASEDGAWSVALPFDGFRPPEWTPGGSFLTWHRLEGLTETPDRLAVRLVRQRDGAVMATAGSVDGWETITLRAE